jgi:lipopolysaccharide/colanic/teichoic acid biosynthesis glycosyltransferase
MSAQPIAEPHFVESADVSPFVAGTEHPHLVYERYRQAAIQQDALAVAAHAAGEFSDINPWVISTVRRCIDIAVAATALLVFLPLILLLMLMVRASSSGPALFRQRRAGRNREDFTLYKIRTMRVEDSPGSAITVSGDPRITAIGKFLRRYKLDELPQFWNVLKGNMSLVGPRPKLPHHEALDLPYRPGITGMATLVFRNEEKILSGIPQDQLDALYEICIKPKKAQLDLEYMRSATLTTDMKLLWRTATVCLFASDDQSEEAGKLISSDQHAVDAPGPNYPG